MRTLAFAVVLMAVMGNSITWYQTGAKTPSGPTSIGTASIVTAIWFAIVAVAGRTLGWW